MRILDRYISHSITKIFSSSIIIFCFLYVLIDIASNLDDLIRHTVPLEVLIRYYITFLPIIFVQTAPIACLIAALITFSNLNSANEIIVMRTAGLHFWTITRSALLLGIIAAALVFFVNERLVPQAMATAENIRNENMSSRADTDGKRKEIIKNLTFYGLRNRLYFIDNFDPNTFDLEGITIIEQDERQNPTIKIVALRGVWTGIAWRFFNCQITEFDPETPNRVRSINYFESRLMDIKETPRDFMLQRLNVEAMNIPQLNAYIMRFSQSGAAKAINNLRVDLHQKIAFPFGIIAILLVGLPFSLLNTRRKALTFTSLGIAVLIGFFYYVINAVSLAFGKGGWLDPVASAWLTPALFFVTSLFLIKRKF